MANKASKRMCFFFILHKTSFLSHLHFQSYKQKHFKNKSHSENANMKKSYLTLTVCS